MSIQQSKQSEYSQSYDLFSIETLRESFKGSAKQYIALGLVAALGVGVMLETDYQETGQSEEIQQTTNE